MWRLLKLAFLSTCLISNAESISTSDYPTEIHQVTTKDGYILQLNRIPHGRNSSESGGGKVVFLMHGLTLLYNTFTHLGPEYGIAYNLADAGYDVWMANARGTKYSRRHVSLDPDKDKFQFFDFSYEEIALFDMPAMIDYVLDMTKQKKLHYIGHSQGATVFFVCTSMIPAYQLKIASAHLLGGAGYQAHMPFPTARILAYNFVKLYATMQKAGIVEIRTPSLNNTIVAGLSTITDIFFHYSVDLFGGTSTKQAAHYFQNIKDKAFRRWDFGDGNLEKYGSVVPPSYNLTDIFVDVTLHYSSSDILVSVEDTLAMEQALPKARVRKVADFWFSHVDYVINPKVKTLVTDYIVEVFNNS